MRHILNRTAIRRASSLGTLLALLTVSAWAAEAPDVGAHLPSQAAADLVRGAAGTDGAFIPAAHVKNAYDEGNLASLLEFATDPIVVVNLTGAEIRQAFERSLALFPQPNNSFLQISGFEVVFNKSAAPNNRIISITRGSAKLEDAKTYSIAMPANLGRGGLGYFKIWDRAKIIRTLDRSLEDVLKGKRYSETAPRWTAQG